MNKVSSGNRRKFATERFIYSDAQDTVAATDDDAKYVRYLVTMRYPQDTARVVSGKEPALTGNNMVDASKSSIAFTAG